ATSAMMAATRSSVDSLSSWISSHAAAEVIALVAENTTYRVSFVAVAATPPCVTRPTVRMAAILPWRATAICADGSNPSRTSFSARASSASSFEGSIPSACGDSAKKWLSGMAPPGRGGSGLQIPEGLQALDDLALLRFRVAAAGRLEEPEQLEGAQRPLGAGTGAVVREPHLHLGALRLFEAARDRTLAVDVHLDQAPERVARARA